MKVTAKVKNNVKTAKVKRKAQAANFKSIQHAAASLRLIVLRSIRKGTKKKGGLRTPAKPGSPPRTWENKTNRRMKRDVLYTPAVTDAYGRSAATVYASPEKSGDKVYQLHEKGGSQTIKVYTNKNSGSDRKSGTNKPMRERSEKERAAIRDYYKNIIRVKKQKESVNVKADYPARPFMEPAVKKILPRLPAVWRTNIQKTFH